MPEAFTDPCAVCRVTEQERYVDRLACQSVVRTIRSLPSGTRPKTHLEVAEIYGLPIDELPKAILQCVANKDWGACLDKEQ